MPELPDVEAYLRRYQRARGHVVAHTHVRDAALLEGITPQALARRLKGKTLRRGRRHGKALLAPAGNGALVLHFGMTGTLEWLPPSNDGALPDHTRIHLETEDGGRLAVTSRRRLGSVGWIGDADRLAEAENLGPDFLDIDAADLARRLRRRSRGLKAALTDQSLVAGIGNVYADEILFQSGLDPRWQTGDLNRKDLTRLHRAGRRIVGRAADADPPRDGFQDRLPSSWLLPRREDGASCPRCSGAIAKIRVNGRATYLCPTCQSRK